MTTHKGKWKFFCIEITASSTRLIVLAFTIASFRGFLSWKTMKSVCFTGRFAMRFILPFRKKIQEFKKLNCCKFLLSPIYTHAASIFLWLFYFLVFHTIRQWKLQINRRLLVWYFEPIHIYAVLPWFHLSFVTSTEN